MLSYEGNKWSCKNVEEGMQIMDVAGQGKLGKASFYT
jgi:hypothetical protein